MPARGNRPSFGCGFTRFAAPLFGPSVRPDAEEPGVAHLAVGRPFHEGDLDDDLRLDPQAFAGQVGGHGEGRLRYQEWLESAAQIREQLVVEAGADAARVDEVISVVVADEE